MRHGAKVGAQKTRISVGFLFFIVFLLSSSPASAAYIYDWSSAQTVTDPAGDANFSGDTSYDGRDVMAAYQVYDAGYLYFRIDLASAPSSVFPPGYANTYGIYIDSKPGVGADSSTMYVPGMLTGIDFIISSDLNFDKFSRMIWDPEFQVWRVDEFKSSSGLQFQSSMNGGTTLEWRVLDGDGAKHIGNSFTWWAGTMLPGDGSAKETYDLTRATVMPIPSAVWLLGSGIIGLIGLKRRKTVKG